MPRIQYTFPEMKLYLSNRFDKIFTNDIVNMIIKMGEYENLKIKQGKQLLKGGIKVYNIIEK